MAGCSRRSAWRSWRSWRTRCGPSHRPRQLPDVEPKDGGQEPPRHRAEIDPAELKVRLEALQAKRDRILATDERNPFRFQPPPAPPPPPKLPPVTMPAGPVGPPPPPPPPPIPPMPLKFMGTVEKPGLTLAALTDCKGFSYAAREGEIDRRPVPAGQDSGRVGHPRIFQRDRPNHRPKEWGLSQVGASSGCRRTMLAAEIRSQVRETKADCVGRRRCARVGVRGRAVVQEGARSGAHRRLGHGGAALHRGAPGEPGQRRIQDRARAGDAERGARSHHQGARARAEGSARRRAHRVQEGRRDGRLESARRHARGRARAHHPRPHREVAPAAGDRTSPAAGADAGRSGAQPGRPHAAQVQLQQLQPARHPELHRHDDRDQHPVRRRLLRTRRTPSRSTASRSRMRCSRSCR